MKLIIYLFAILCFMSVAHGHSAHMNKVDDEKEQPRKASSYFGDVKYLYKTYQDCSSSDLSTCLKLKLYTVIDRIARSNSDFKVYEGVTFVNEIGVDFDDAPPKTESEIEASLPRSLEDKEQTLNSLIMDRIMSYFGSHTLKVKFPSVEDMKRSINEARKGGIGGGGGGKDKKNGHYIMIPLLLGSTLVPLAFGALALLAGKALIVSKLALALASIIGIKKLISGQHHHESAHEVVVSGGHSGGGWGRNLDSQKLAYKGQNNA